MDPPRLAISDNLRAHMNYRKFAGAAPRVMILESGYWLDSACAGAAERMGWEVRRVPVMMEGVLPRAQIEALLLTLMEFRPDFLLNINASGVDEEGMFADFFGKLHLPQVTWFVDDPRTILMGRTCYGGDYTMALTWDSTYEPDLRACDFGTVHTLPLGVDESLFHQPPAEEWTLPPTFVGSSMTDFCLREWEWLAARPHVALPVAQALDAGCVTRDKFAQGLVALVGDDAASSWDEHERRHAELYCFIEGTRRERKRFVQALEEEGMWVAGDDAWREVVSHTLPLVNYERDLAAHYSNCPVNLNHTSVQMPTAVNQRVLDCPAAGGFLLTDAQAQLNDLFDVENETAVYHTLDEARELLRHFMANPGERTRITLRARERVLNEHTYGHRLRHIVSLLKSRFA